MAGRISTVAGSEKRGFAGDGGAATNASLNKPHGVAFHDGAIYIADTQNYRLRRVGADGKIATLAGTGKDEVAAEKGPALEAELRWPRAVAVDAKGRVFLADASEILRVDPDGTIHRIAGNGKKPGKRFVSVADGKPATKGQLGFPSAVAVDGAGRVFVAETGPHSVRRIEPDGKIATVQAGNDLTSPEGVAVDAAGRVFIADTQNDRVLRVDVDGTITTVAGASGEKVKRPSGDGGPATKAGLYLPVFVAVDAAGRLYISDIVNHRVRRVDVDGTIDTVAGTGEEGFSGDGGPATKAQLSGPRGLAVDPAGTRLYIADLDNNRIRCVELS